MQVTANVAVKNVAKAATSADMPNVKPNGSQGEKPMSFAEFEQRLDKHSGAEKNMSDAEKAELGSEGQPSMVADAPPLSPSAEELALQVEQLLSQATKPEGASLPAEAEAEVSTEVLQAVMADKMNLAGATEQGKLSVQEQMQQLIKPGAAPTSQVTPLTKDPQPIVNEALLTSKEPMLQVKAAAIPNEMLVNNKELMATIDPSVIEKLTTTSVATPTLHVHSAMSSNINMLTQAAQASSSSANAQAQQLQASVDITQPEWGRDLVDQLRSRMQLSKTDQIQHAHVRLDPPELGRLEINLRLEGDKVSVHFTAAHPQLREALAANADRLRFDFDGSQMQLADVSVSSGMYQQSRQQSGSNDEPAVIANNVMAAQQETASASVQALEGRYESMV